MGNTSLSAYLTAQLITTFLLGTLETILLWANPKVFLHLFVMCDEELSVSQYTPELLDSENAPALIVLCWDLHSLDSNLFVLSNGEWNRSYSFINFITEASNKIFGIENTTLQNQNRWESSFVFNHLSFTPKVANLDHAGQFHHTDKDLTFWSNNRFDVGLIFGEDLHCRCIVHEFLSLWMTVETGLALAHTAAACGVKAAACWGVDVIVECIVCFTS